LLAAGANEVRKNELDEKTLTPTGEGQGGHGRGIPLSAPAVASPYGDPRPDIAGDSALWSSLLPRAYALDGSDPHGCYGALLGLRCWGAILVREADRYRIAAGEIDPAEYEEFRRRYLLPHRDAITALLAELSAPEAVAA
jgi:hypothetical protein